MITRSVVDEVLGQPPVDRAARIEALRKQLAKVCVQVDDERRLENRCALIQSAFGKLKAQLRSILTPEEYSAIDGAYIFIHGTFVDMVRHIPSATDKGEGVRFEKMLDMADMMAELKAIEEG